MTDAELYLKAARLINSGEEEFSCCAISEVGWSTGCELTTKLRVDYEQLFAPKTPPFNRPAWGADWNENDDEEVKNCRILALCFMAAMCDSHD